MRQPSAAPLRPAVVRPAVVKPAQRPAPQQWRADRFDPPGLSQAKLSALKLPGLTATPLGRGQQSMAQPLKLERMSLKRMTLMKRSNRPALLGPRTPEPAALSVGRKPVLPTPEDRHRHSRNLPVAAQEAQRSLMLLWEELIKAGQLTPCSVQLDRKPLVVLLAEAHHSRWLAANQHHRSRSPGQEQQVARRCGAGTSRKPSK